MRHIKKLSLPVILILLTLLSSGCWNYREIETIAIVSGFAIDKADDKFLVTTEIINIKGSRETQISTSLISAEGISIFDAVRNIIKIAGKRLYFSHSEIIVVDKDIAKEGLVPVTDWIIRDTEPRNTLHFIVSKEKSAKEILEQQTITSNILSFELDEMITSESKLSNSPDVEVWEFISDLSESGISATLPTVNITTVNDKKFPEITGTGIFKEDKLLGFLDGEETKTMLFIKNKISGGLLVGKEYKDNSPTNISLEIFKNKTKLNPHLIDGKITMEITTDTDVAIDENGGKDNYIDEEGRMKLKRDFEAMLENNIKSLVKKVQEQYGSDIFGFGRAVKLSMPGLWKQIEPRWGSMYTSINVEVHSTINIKNSAFHSMPIKVGD